MVTEPGFAVDARELNAGMEGTLANLVEGSLNGYRFRLAAIQTDLDSGQIGTLEFNPYDYVPDGSVITGCIDSLPCGWHGVSAAAVRKTTRDGQLFPWVYEIQSGESAGMSPFRIFVLIIYS